MLAGRIPRARQARAPSTAAARSPCAAGCATTSLGKMDKTKDRGLFFTGGICAIAWPILSEFVFYAVYPLLAGGGVTPQPGGPEGMMIRLAEAGQRPAVVALEWGKVAVQLLQLPFLLAMYRLLRERGQRNLALVGVGLGLVSMVLIVISHTFLPTLSHALGQAYADAESPETRRRLCCTRVVWGWLVWPWFGAALGAYEDGWVWLAHCWPCRPNCLLD